VRVCVHRNQTALPKKDNTVKSKSFIISETVHNLDVNLQLITDIKSGASIQNLQI